jgi:hypothetical protein
MLKQSTGEPYAGEPHVRFGGKGETSSLPLSVFKSRLYGFAAQKYSTKPQLKNCRLARRYARYPLN